MKRMIMTITVHMTINTRFGDAYRAYLCSCPPRELTVG